MEDFVLGLKHRTVLWGKAEFNVARAEHPVSEKSQPSHGLGLAFTEPSTCIVYTLADTARPRKHAAFIIYLYTHHA